MDVFSLPQIEARRVLGSGAPVYVPVNPIEYHGPHLSLRTDGVISEGLNRDLHLRLSARHPDWPYLCVPDPNVGCGTVPGHGSRPVSFQAVKQVVIETCKALVSLGATRVVLMTFHGDPLHNLALQAGVDWLSAHGAQGFAPMPLLLAQIFEPDPSVLAPLLAPLASASDRSAMAEDWPHDFHAGFGETSLALHYAPDTVSGDHTTLPPCAPLEPRKAMAALPSLARRLGRTNLAGELNFGALVLTWLALRPFPGYTTRPHLANPETGRLLADLACERYAKAAEAVFTQGAAPPRAGMRWVLGLSLGGRIDLGGSQPEA